MTGANINMWQFTILLFLCLTVSNRIKQRCDGEKKQTKKEKMKRFRYIESKFAVRVKICLADRGWQKYLMILLPALGEAQNM
jgi:hypothetical protein